MNQTTNFDDLVGKTVRASVICASHILQVAAIVKSVTPPSRYYVGDVVVKVYSDDPMLDGAAHSVGLDSVEEIDVHEFLGLKKNVKFPEGGFSSRVA